MHTKPNNSLRRSILPTLCALSLGSLAACGQVDASSEETRDWDVTLYVGVNHHVTEVMQEFAAEVNETTEGAVEIVVRPAGELPFAADETLARVGDGSVALGDTLATFVSGSCRVAGLPSLPGLVTTYEEWDRAWPVLQPFVEDCFNAEGATVLFQYSWPPQQIWGAGEVPDSLEEVGGKDLRVTGAEVGTMIKEFIGASPVSLTTPEVSDAAQRGLIDGVVTSAVSLPGEGWDEFLDWGYIINSNLGPSYVLANMDELESLPAPLRTDVEEAARTAEQRMFEEMSGQDLDAMKQMRSDGMAIIDAADDEVEEFTNFARTNVWNEWAEQGDSNTVDALAAIRDALGK